MKNLLKLNDKSQSVLETRNEYQQDILIPTAPNDLRQMSADKENIAR